MAKSHRTHYTLPAGRGTNHEPLRALLDRLAAPHLPALLRQVPTAAVHSPEDDEPAGEDTLDADAEPDRGLEQAA